MVKIKKYCKYIIICGIAIGFLLCNSIKEPTQNNQKEIQSTVNSFQEQKVSVFLEVIRVVDGDTIVVRSENLNEKVRLIGIDTPESVKKGAPVEKYGKEAFKYTRNILTGKKVRLKFDVQKRDKYGRILAYVYLQDGRMFNKILLEEGYAQVMTVPPNVKYQKEFLVLQRKAKNQGKGLWGE